MKADQEKAAFEQAIAENPYDDVTRKVFADWLEEHGFDDEAVLQREWTVEKHKDAVAFMERYADLLSEAPYEDESDNRSYEVTAAEVLAAAHGCLDGSGYGIGLGFDTPDEVWEYREAFWQHFMVLTGRPVPEGRRGDTFVSCAC
jgi:uncharacterized protein (TIGR02996 family)